MTESSPANITWTIDQLRDLARQRLRKPETAEGPMADDGDGLRGDFDLNGGPEAFAHLAAKVPRPAAVLIPIIDRAEPTVLFTVRPKTMAEHAGQIAFPGGRTDPGDVSPEATALREADEEVGLRADHVECLGRLDPYRTGTGYLITPVVAIVDAGFSARANPIEVSDVFEVPLAFLMTQANHRVDQRTINGIIRRYHAMPYEQHYIWGATAGILKMLYERLTGP